MLVVVYFKDHEPLSSKLLCEYLAGVLILFVALQQMFMGELLME